ncbi:hypothetical protein E8E13_006629 [Curvularia kusanoi]|uniref:Uncharacterized protein n=1 Tax=Curvularia kusanoi TaxID=90978 RepID=A0A9P4TM94_CURKU|nr:hypothetical protein E8E13_006629 [Curvularia kusanoi]
MATKNMQPYVEDCFSDDGHDGQGVSINEAFSPEPSPGKANVRTKRSNPGDMGSNGTQKGPNIDVKSDSGYSSQSVAGLSSADSAASAASSSQVPSARPAAPSPTPASKPSRRPSTTRRESTQSSQSASRPAPSRRESQTSHRPTAERRRTLTTPQPPVPKERRDSLRDAESRPRLHSRRLSMLNAQPAESAPDVSHHHVHDTRSQVSDPAQYPGSSPRESRPPPRYHTPQGGPVIQPAISRRLSVSSRQPRPTSYHGESPYPYMPHPHVPQEHGPPLSRSAYGNMHFVHPHMNQPYMPQFPQQGYAPAPTAYMQAQQMQPMRDQQRPQLQARTQTLNSAYPHPQSPVTHVERSGRNMPSTRYHTNPPPPAQRQPTRIAYPQEQDDSESESESDYSEEEPDHYARFPQSAHQRRPSLRHASTTPAPQVPEIRRPQTIVVPDPRGHDRNPALRPSRRLSTSRPQLPSHKAQTEYPSLHTRTIVENSRSSRRQPQVYERSPQDHRSRQQEYSDRSRTKRSSQVYENRAPGRDFELEYQDDEDEAERRPLGRRGTNTDRRRSHRPVEVRQAADAEDYITASRGERETLADQSYQVAKTRSKRASVGPSEAESSRSRGSDNNGEIRLRIGNDAPVTLSLNGDMEGRVLSLVPVENGMNELVISSNNRGESQYRSERGSAWGGERERRAIMSSGQPRRDAEEMTERMTERSSRSNRTRREEESRRIHRSGRKERRDTDYRY